MKIIHELLTMVEPYMLIDEKLTMHFDNPVSSESHSNHPTGKESHRCRDESDRGIMGKYNKYTPQWSPVRKFI